MSHRRWCRSASIASATAAVAHPQLPPMNHRRSLSLRLLPGIRTGLARLWRLNPLSCRRPASVSSMDEIYRFRSCCRLLGVEGELASRMIYFAESSQLNDPMEDVRRLVWHGDRIVWMNLFRHYLCCLNYVYLMIRLGTYGRPATSTDIPINKRWDQLPTDYGALLDQVWNDIRGELPLEQIAIRLEQLERRVYSSELEFYVGSIHECAFAAMDRAHAAFGTRDPAAPVSERISHLSLVLPEFFESLMHGLDDPEELDETLERLHHHLQRERLKARVAQGDFADDVEVQDKCFLVLDFPREYVKQLTRATSPVWSTACFTKTYANPTQWSHYADRHKGVCLVFGPEDDADRAWLPLRPLRTDKHIEQPTGPPESMFHRFYFYPIRYVNSLDDVDFFERISQMPEESVRRVWFTDLDGHTSSVATHLTADSDIETWRASAWAELYRDICTKTEEWQHEQEVRLVNYDTSESLLPDQQLRWEYKFSALKGIIFGINTPNAHKLQIIESIRRQCQHAGRTEFDFRQAYSSTRGQGVQSFPLDIDLSPAVEATQQMNG